MFGLAIVVPMKVSRLGAWKGVDGCKCTYVPSYLVAEDGAYFGIQSHVQYIGICDTNLNDVSMFQFELQN